MCTKKFDLKSSILIADNSNLPGDHRCITSLYRAQSGEYFANVPIDGKGRYQQFDLDPSSAAHSIYNSLEIHHVPFEQAFPGIRKYFLPMPALLLADNSDLPGIKRPTLYLHRTSLGEYYELYLIDATHYKQRLLTLDAAIRDYNLFKKHHASFEEAFPGVA